MRPSTRVEGAGEEEGDNIDDQRGEEGTGLAGDGDDNGRAREEEEEEEEDSGGGGETGVDSGRRGWRW